MAREQRKDVDYFPHDCTHGRKMHIIETKYGNDGYAAWFKLLEQLGKANNHYIDISDDMTLMFLTSVFKTDEEKTISILSDLAKLGAIDKFLFDEHRIIFSQKFADSIQDAYRKRKSEMFQYSDILNEINQKNGQSGGSLNEIQVNQAEVILKEKNSKVKESKEDFKEEEKKSKNEIFGLELLESQTWIETISMQNKIASEEIKKWIETFNQKLITELDTKISKKDYAGHFSRWLPGEISKIKKEGYGKSESLARPSARNR
jgi:hypothetical protein